MAFPSVKIHFVVPPGRSRRGDGASGRGHSFENLQESALPSWYPVAHPTPDQNVHVECVKRRTVGAAAVLAGRWREIHPASALLGALCLCYYVVGLPH
jgi:hypothetical protein